MRPPAWTPTVQERMLGLKQKAEAVVFWEEHGLKFTRMEWNDRNLGATRKRRLPLTHWTGQWKRRCEAVMIEQYLDDYLDRGGTIR
jgi:hypothetical protein